jgi:hypothetical protein
MGDARKRRFDMSSDIEPIGVKSKRGAAVFRRKA